MLVYSSIISKNIGSCSDTVLGIYECLTDFKCHDHEMIASKWVQDENQW